MTAVSIALPEGASSNRTQQIMAGLAQKMRKLPGVKNVMEVSGIDILSFKAMLRNDSNGQLVKQCRERLFQSNTQ